MSRRMLSALLPLLFLACLFFHPAPGAAALMKATPPPRVATTAPGPFARLLRAVLGALSPAPAPTPRAQGDTPPPVLGGTVTLGPMINPDGHH